MTLTPDTRNPASPRSRGLDGLRGLAALGVLTFHVWLYARLDPPATALSGTADVIASDLRWGLILFFVLSGFLLYQPWLRAAADGERPDLRSYVRRRAARILPAYYVALVGSLVLLSNAGSVPGVRLPSAALVPAFFVFGENLSSHSLLTLDPPMWTLAVEVSFYAVLPLIGLLGLRLRRVPPAALPLGLLAIGMAWSTAVVELGGPLTLTKLLPAMLPYFALGMLVAALADRLSRPGWLASVAVLGVSLQAWLERHASPVAISLVHELPVAVGFAALTALAASARGPKTLRSRPLVALGTVSYGLYLWNVPVIWTMRAAGLLPLSPALAFAPVLGISLTLASASWLLVERPAIRRARNPRRRRAATAPRRVAVPPVRAYAIRPVA